MPKSSFMTAAKRILRFVKGIIFKGIHITKSPVNRIVAFCDSDFVGDPNDMKSITRKQFNIVVLKKASNGIQI